MRVIVLIAATVAAAAVAAGASASAAGSATPRSSEAAKVETAFEASPIGATRALIANPDWLRRPSAEDFERYYPERARRMGVEGRASISCTINNRGTLESCSVSSEDPADAGFGDAALGLSRLFKMRSMTKDGAPVDGGKITIPINFRRPQGQTAPTTTGRPAGD